ncbi:hypothetical protein [Planococcus salinus]|uniref:hypothetical protein n=1 Tax=Planococcus salinus TaxID=1848460 RepID=UPI001314ECDD|nr:hypothetical protein [Planococcus salinus]
MKFRKMMILLTALLLFAGCSAEANSSIKSIEDVDSDKLAEYNGTYVGDNSDVLAIIRELAGAETFNVSRKKSPSSSAQRAKPSGKGEMNFGWRSQNGLPFSFRLSSKEESEVI